MQCNWLIAPLFLVGIIYVQGQCPPDYVEMYQVVRVLDRALDKVESKCGFWKEKIADKKDRNAI